MKRSTCASGSGYVPSNSIGFCVASTTNGRASSCVCTSTVTRPSCMHSSRPDCVLGLARLISSTSTMLAKIGPGPELEARLALVEDVRPDDVGGQQVGGALHARELQVHRARQRAGERRLADARQVLDQDVALGDEADEDVVEQVLAHLDRAADRRRRAAAPSRRRRGPPRRRRVRSARSRSHFRTQRDDRIADGARDLGLGRPFDVPVAGRGDDRDLVVVALEADVRAARCR